MNIVNTIGVSKILHVDRVEMKMEYLFVAISITAVVSMILFMDQIGDFLFSKLDKKSKS